MGSLAEDLRRVDREIALQQINARPGDDARRRKQKEYILVLTKRNGEDINHRIVAYDDEEAIRFACLHMDICGKPSPKNFKKNSAKALICDGRVVYPPKQ